MDWPQVPQPRAQEALGAKREQAAEGRREGGKLGCTLHCTFAECRARGMSRNCGGGGDKVLAARWTSQNRHRENEKGWSVA